VNSGSEFKNQSSVNDSGYNVNNSQSVSEYQSPELVHIKFRTHQNNATQNNENNENDMHEDQFDLSDDNKDNKLVKNQEKGKESKENANQLPSKAKVEAKDKVKV